MLGLGRYYVNLRCESLDYVLGLAVRMCVRVRASVPLG